MSLFPAIQRLLPSNYAFHKAKDSNKCRSAQTSKPVLATPVHSVTQAPRTLMSASQWVRHRCCSSPGEYAAPSDSDERRSFISTFRYIKALTSYHLQLQVTILGSYSHCQPPRAPGMHLSVLLAILAASTLDRARASYVELAVSCGNRVLCIIRDAKRDSELVLLSPERLDNVGHGNSRPPCPPPGCTSATSKLCWDGKYDAVSWNHSFWHATCPD